MNTDRNISRVTSSIMTVKKWPGKSLFCWFEFHGHFLSKNIGLDVPERFLYQSLLLWLEEWYWMWWWEARKSLRTGSFLKKRKQCWLLCPLRRGCIILCSCPVLSVLYKKSRGFCDYSQPAPSGEMTSWLPCSNVETQAHIFGVKLPPTNTMLVTSTPEDTSEGSKGSLSCRVWMCFIKGLILILWLWLVQDFQLILSSFWFSAGFEVWSYFQEAMASWMEKSRLMKRFLTQSCSVWPMRWYPEGKKWYQGQQQGGKHHHFYLKGDFPFKLENVAQISVRFLAAFILNTILVYCVLQYFPLWVWNISSHIETLKRKKLQFLFFSL